MKQTLLFFMLLMAASAAYSQDYIIKKNGEDIKSKIVEVLNDRVVYKEYDHQDGPLRSIDISDIDIILYENGKREKLTYNKSVSDDGADFYVGPGIGYSYGLIGLRFQLRMLEEKRFAVHAGVGLDLDINDLLPSVGVKYYPYKDLYLNLQYGVVGTEIDDNDDDMMQFATSFMIGGDWTWGTNVGFGLNAGLGIGYLSEKSETRDRTIAAFDVGFIIKF